MDCNKSNSKREVYSDTILPQGTNKQKINRQPNLRTEKQGKEGKKKLVGGNKSYRSKQK